MSANEKLATTGKFEADVSGQDYFKAECISLRSFPSPYDELALEGWDNDGRGLIITIYNYENVVPGHAYKIYPDQGDHDVSVDVHFATDDSVRWETLAGGTLTVNKMDLPNAHVEVSFGFSAEGDGNVAKFVGGANLTGFSLSRRASTVLK